MGALSYLVYAAAFVAVVLAVEGTWLAVRGLTGEGREVNRRLSLLRRTQDERAGLKLIARNHGGRLAEALDARLPALREALWAARAPLNSVQLLGCALAGFVGLAALLLIARLPPQLAALIALGVAVLAPGMVLSFMAARRRARFLAQMPNAVDLMARSLQAGHPVASAMGVVATQMPDPIGTEFGLVIDEMTYGLDRDEALENLARRVPSAEIRMFVASLQVTRESGGNLAEVFLNLGEVMRAKAQLRMKVNAITSEGRLSFWVISALPMVVAGAIMLLRPEYFLEVHTDPLFAPLMCAPPILLALGAATIWRMINIKV